MILALVIVACILFGIAAAGVPTGRVNLGWAGLLCFALSTIVGKF